MESLRTVLAILLCVAIWVVWVTFFAPKQPAPNQPVPPPVPPVAQEKPGEAVGKAAVAPRERPEVAAKVVELLGDPREKPRFSLRLTNQGAGIQEASLPEFQARDGKGPEVLIPPGGGPPVTLGLSVDRLKVGGKAVDPAELVAFGRENWEVEAAGPGGPVVFNDEGNGLRLRKEIQTVPGSYHLQISLTFENPSEEERQFHYRLWGPTDMTSESLHGAGGDYRLVYGESGVGGEVRVQVLEVASIKQPEWANPGQNHIVFIGCTNNYFAAILAAADPSAPPFLDRGFADLIPDPFRSRQLATEMFGRAWDQLDPNQRKTVEEKVYKFARTGVQSRPVSLAPGKAITHQFLFFLGPRDEKVLSNYPQHRLTETNYYGWWTPLVKVFLQVLKGLHFVLFKSWGLAIMGLTLLVRLCLHPLNRKQQASMMRYTKKMAAVKPQMDAIKERYGKDRLRMNQEMQKLFREQGINPTQMMGGCLMVFLQMPVWYALYRTIEVSLDLRRAPFLWIEDLTQPDRVVNLPFTIPFLGWNAINILPVIYVILTILQQKMQPKPADPQMQQQMKMMTYMMVFFGFLFYSFPAGFLLYFITSAAIGMLESKIIKRVLAREGLGPNQNPPGLAPQPAPAPRLPFQGRPGKPKRKR